MNNSRNGTIFLSNLNLCLGFTDTFDGCADFFTDWLSAEYNIIRNDAKPDYLIFGDANFGTNNLQYEDCIKVFYTGENQRFWNYKCHFGITFDHIDDERHYRIPLYVLNIHYLSKRHGFKSPSDHFFERLPLTKTDFCGFVNSNGGCAFRNDFFHTLSQYKKVDSAGPLFNNIGYVLPRDDQGILHKLKFLESRKFTVAFENGSHAGYATEKALEAWYAGSVPLYWGSPTVALDFNPDCMISWHEYLSVEKMIDRIKEVDTNRMLYDRMNYQPLFPNNTPPHTMDQGRFLEWFKRHVYKGSRV